MSKLEHPALFVLALVLVVTAGQNMVAFLANAAGLKSLGHFFKPS